MPNQHDAEKRVPTNFRLPRTLIEQVRSTAASRDETVTELVIRALTREVALHETDTPTREADA